MSDTEILRYELQMEVMRGRMKAIFGAVYVNRQGKGVTWALEADATIDSSLETGKYEEPQVHMSSSNWDLAAMRARTRCLVLALQQAEEWMSLIGKEPIESTKENRYVVTDVTERALALSI